MTGSRCNRQIGSVQPAPVDGFHALGIAVVHQAQDAEAGAKAVIGIQRGPENTLDEVRRRQADCRAVPLLRSGC